MTALSERLQREAPSRELDAEIAGAFGWGVFEVNDPVTGREFVWKKFGWPSRPKPPSFSSSVDAALALFREVLPGWVIRRLGWVPGEPLVTAELLQPPQGEYQPAWCIPIHRQDDHLAMALCAAICRAMGK